MILRIYNHLIIRLIFLALILNQGESFEMAHEINAENLIVDFNIAEDIAIESGEYWWQEWISSVFYF